MNARYDIAASSEPIDPIILAEAQAESRIVRFGWISPRIGLALLIVAMMLLMMLGVKYRAHLRSYQAPTWLLVPALIAALAIVGYVYEVVSKTRRTRRFRIALTKRGVPVCVECGYSLRGLDVDVVACPECGAVPPREDLCNEQRSRQKVS